MCRSSGRVDRVGDRTDTIRTSAGLMVWSLALLCAVSALPGCSSTADNKSSCAPAPYTAMVNGKPRAQIETCAGILPTDPMLITVKVGDTVQVRAAGGSFSYGYPTPTVVDQRAVKLSIAAQHAASYAAVRPGGTDLKVASQFCQASAPVNTLPTCAVFRVTVRR
jgi:hypothetical protein